MNLKFYKPEDQHKPKNHEFVLAYSKWNRPYILKYFEFDHSFRMGIKTNPVNIIKWSHIP